MALVDTTALVVADPATALERAADPGEFVVQCLERGKTWLAEALEQGDLDRLLDAKGFAEVLRVATVQKQIGKDAELTAAELVRRAERALALGVRAGQEAGEIRRRGEQGRAVVPDVHGQATNIPKVGINDYLPEPVERRDAYSMADDVTDEEFEEALAEAKAEGNLSRANVVRKVKGEAKPQPRNRTIEERVEQICAALARSSALTSHQIGAEIGVSAERVREIAREYGIDIPADKVVGRQPKVDPNQVIENIIAMATPEPVALAFLDYAVLDRDRIDEWVSSLSDAIRSLQTIKRNLQKELTP